MTSILRVQRTNLVINGLPHLKVYRALIQSSSRFHSSSTILDSSSSPQLRIRSHLGSLNPAHVPCSTLESLYNSINSYAPIPNRGLLHIHGRDSSKLLQGLITNHMVKLRQEPGFYSAFLSPQGRLQFEGFLYVKPCSEVPNTGAEISEDYLLDFASIHTESLLTQLKKYKLRNQVEITNVSEDFTQYQIWGPRVEEVQRQGLDPREVRLPPSDDLAMEQSHWTSVCVDPRAPGMGIRAVVIKDSMLCLPSSFLPFLEADYTCKRLLSGIPEGEISLPAGVTLPLEANFDFMKAIDFQKGCYLGQETTIRTYHRGTVRKRVLPLTFHACSTPRPLLTPYVNFDYTGPPLLPRADVYLSDLVPSHQSNSISEPPPTIDYLKGSSRASTNIISRVTAYSEASPSVIPIKAFVGDTFDSDRDNVPLETAGISTIPVSIPRLKSMGKAGESLLNLGLALIRLEAVEAVEPVESKNKKKLGDITKVMEFQNQSLLTRLGHGTERQQRGAPLSSEVLLLPWIPTWWKFSLPQRK